MMLSRRCLHCLLFDVGVSRASIYKFQRRRGTEDGSETLQDKCKKPLEYQKLLQEAKEYMVNISVSFQYFVNVEKSYTLLNEGFLWMISQSSWHYFQGCYIYADYTILGAILILRFTRDSVNFQSKPPVVMVDSQQRLMNLEILEYVDNGGHQSSLEQISNLTNIRSELDSVTIYMRH